MQNAEWRGKVVRFASVCEGNDEVPPCKVPIIRYNNYRGRVVPSDAGLRKHEFAQGQPYMKPTGSIFPAVTATALAAILLVSACHAALVPPSPTVVLIPVELDTVENAQAAVAFPLLIVDPTTLPSGMSFNGAELLPAGEQQSIVLQYAGASQHLELQETTLSAGSQLLPPVSGPSEKVFVRSRQAFWVEVEPGLSALIWNEDGRWITLSGNLPRDDLFRIAEGLKTLGPL